MTKKLFLLLALISLFGEIEAQSITLSPNSLTLPIVTDFNQVAIPHEGMLVYKNNESAVYYYNGAHWLKVDQTARLTVPYISSEDFNGSIFLISNSNAGNSNASAINASVSVNGKAIIATASNTNDNAHTVALFAENQNSGFTGYAVQASHSGYGSAVYSSALLGNSLHGFTETGNALKVKANSGYAIHSEGKVKLFGGDLEPGPGKILTAMDETGQAQWKELFPLFRSISSNSSLFTLTNSEPNNVNSIAFQGASLGLGTGVVGSALNNSPTANNSGVTGINGSQNEFGYGVYAQHNGTGRALVATTANGTGIQTSSTTGIAILATSNTSDGGSFSSNSGNGIRTSSQQGPGLFSHSLDSVGVMAESINNTGIRAVSNNGTAADFEANFLALKTKGGVRMGGVQMTPGTAKFLKSTDNLGTAKWESFLPYAETSNEDVIAFQITNSALGNLATKAISGEVNDEGMGVMGLAKKTSPSTQTIGVLGKNLSTTLYGYGVKGEHAGNGIGVHGSASGAGTGVMGVANNAAGIGGQFSSQNGYAFQSSGKVRIGGGDTAPDAGKVLIASNNQGDATWQSIDQNPKIGFKSFLATQNVLNNSLTFLNILSPEFEDGGGVNALVDQYIVPSSGVYQVQIDMAWDQAAVGETVLQIRKNAAVVYETVHNSQFKFQTLNITQNLKLEVGDSIEFGVYQFSGSTKSFTNSSVKNSVSVVKVY